MPLSLLSLWLPILLSAVVVFAATFIAWTVLPHHRSDWVPIPEEQRLLDALRGHELPRGQYAFPHAMTREGSKSPDAAGRLEEGPVGFLIIAHPGSPDLAKRLFQQFLFVLGVSFMVGYVGYAAVEAGADFPHVFRVLGTAAVLAYAAAEIPRGIWFGHSWSSVLKSVIDGIAFGLLTGGVFGWFWPG